MPTVQKKGNAKSRAQREAEKKLDEYAVAMQERGDWARKIYNAQDTPTRLAIDEMIEVISSMADRSGEARVKLDSGEVVQIKAPMKIFENGWLWVAIRLCVAAYDWDIQVAKFHPVRKISKKAGVK